MDKWSFTLNSKKQIFMSGFLSLYALLVFLVVLYCLKKDKQWNK
ncbi:hypothetical protein BTG_07365 [Bacillus thuringiensis HD-771]|uniref:Uncharacterized protein n=2 Tax=Bacillus cereus group TaxID=86661 RepID=B7IXA5_BACC2|nr:hypothetical protein BCG9842_B2825 [Bacillus cereus G9842]AFQ14955.1 hypothetical protein BTG_07365 [Bacillus thuringiensis HD-771]